MEKKSTQNRWASDFSLWAPCHRAEKAKALRRNSTLGTAVPSSRSVISRPYFTIEESSGFSKWRAFEMVAHFHIPLTVTFAWRKSRWQKGTNK